uniref:Uncharacterized protein n=1 Tax=viral metagenome TaxID=1070528 RepID=A0A6C0CL38_9ZZZZ
MNSFYILLHNDILQDTGKLFKYFESCFPFVPATSYLPIMNSIKMRNYDLTSIFVYQHLYKFIEWYQNERCKTFNVLDIYKKKMRLMFEIQDNMLISEETKTAVMKRYEKVQRQYMAFCRLAYLWKLKKSRYSVTTDLYLNEIDESNSMTCLIYQNKTKFLFHIPDLLKIINKALFHDWILDFIVKSNYPMNPYNKQIFTESNLYNIYFHIRMKTSISIPTLLHLWFLENFDFPCFVVKHVQTIRRYCIRHFVNIVTSSNTMVYDDICTMLRENRYSRRWKIHPKFPKDVLVDKLRHVLYKYYLITYYAVGAEESVLLETEIWSTLTHLYNKNPHFGSQIKIVNKGFKPSSFSFKTTHHTDISGGTFIFGSTNNESSQQNGIINDTTEENKDSESESESDSQSDNSSLVNSYIRPYATKTHSDDENDDIIFEYNIDL